MADNPTQPRTIYDATLIELGQACLKAGRAIGSRETQDEFRITVSFESNTGELYCEATHWFRPTPHAFLDCRAIGKPGTARQCIEALGTYVARFEPSGRQPLPARMPQTPTTLDAAHSTETAP